MPFNRPLWKRRLAERRKLLAVARKVHARALESVRAAKRVLARHPELQPKPSGAAKGIDVSNNQGTVNFAAVKGAGYRFVICKATEGQGFVDPFFRANITNARKAGLLVGAYHFLRPRPGRTGAAEAADFVRQLKAAGIGKGDIRPVIDIEDTDLGVAATRQYVGEFAHAVKAATGIQPILYTYPAFLSWADTYGCPLWIANYDVTRPTIPSPWKSYAIWQFSSKGKVPGVSGNCDVNTCPDLRKILA